MGNFRFVTSVSKILKNWAADVTYFFSRNFVQNHLQAAQVEEINTLGKGKEDH